MTIDIILLLMGKKDCLVNYDIKNYTQEDINNQKKYIEENINNTLKEYNVSVNVTNIEKIQLNYF